MVVHQELEKGNNDQGVENLELQYIQDRDQVTEADDAENRRAQNVSDLSEMGIRNSYERKSTVQEEQSLHEEKEEGNIILFHT